MSDFLKTVKERVVVYDGAMGTNIQTRNPTLDDYWGKENCSEVLVLSRPDMIRDIHADFLGVGCDVVETDTFGGARVVLAEYDLQDKVAEINIAAARIAKEVAQQFSTKDKPRFVAGSIGPTTKLPSLGHITFDNMVAGYTEQALALIEGGVEEIVECGPGRVLTGLNRRIERRAGLEFLALEDPDSIAAALAATKEDSHA
jgi:5-methyltetrahydrofolate--homocysteine methyltransferase